MLKFINRKTAQYSAAFVMGTMVMTGDAFADAEAPTAGEGTWNTIFQRFTTSIADVPNFIAAISYLFGVLLAVLGILKIKDHVENPSQTPLKEGAIRLAVGGALFALPIFTEAMMQMMDVDATDKGALSAKVNQVYFHTGSPT